MLRWLLSLFRRKPVPWQYVGHVYEGLDTPSMTHVYLVTYARGRVSVVRTYKFHASTLEPKPAAKLAVHFAREAAKLK